MTIEKPTKRRTDPALAGTTFSSIAPEEHFGINLNVRAGEKVGKTFLALATAPEPVCYLNGDRDNSRLIRRLVRKGRKILAAKDYCYTLPGPKQITRAMKQDEKIRINQANANHVGPIWSRFVKELEAAGKSRARTVVIDTGTWAYQTIRLANFGTLSIPKYLAQEYKGAFESVLHTLDPYGKVVIWIHRTAAEWEDFTNDKGEPDSRTTGRFVTAGYREIDFVMDATLELEYDMDDGGVRRGTIVKGIGGVGKVFQGETLSIPHVCAAITRTKPEDWV